jgi:hypothetical protein
MQDSYNIYFDGEILEGEQLATVRQRVAALFNAREATLDKLFSGKTQLIKRHCSREEAERYEKAMHRAGARVRLVAVEESAAAVEEPAGTTPSAQRPAQDGSQITLAPSGTEVLRPDERRQHSAPVLDLSAYSLSPSGERLAPASPPPPPPPDTGDLRTEEIGEGLPTLQRPPPPPPPDTSRLSLAEREAGLQNSGDRTPAPPAPDTTHLSVEAPHIDD